MVALVALAFVALVAVVGGASLWVASPSDLALLPPVLCQGSAVVGASLWVAF